MKIEEIINSKHLKASSLTSRERNVQHGFTIPVSVSKKVIKFSKKRKSNFSETVCFIIQSYFENH